MKRAFGLILLASGILWLHGLVPARALACAAAGTTIRVDHGRTSILPADESGDSGDSDDSGDSGDSGD
jgi:hypothetical protein